MQQKRLFSIEEVVIETGICRDEHLRPDEGRTLEGRQSRSADVYRRGAATLRLKLSPQ
jgi:hypothetical protein